MNDKPREDEPHRAESAPRDEKPERPRRFLGDRATDQRAQHSDRDAEGRASTGDGRDSAASRTESKEPPQLRSGKEFHKHLQNDAKQRFGAEPEKHVQSPDRRNEGATRPGRMDLYYRADNPAGKDLIGEIKVRNLARYEERGATNDMVGEQSRRLTRYRDGVEHGRTSAEDTTDEPEPIERQRPHGLMIIRDSSRSDDAQTTEWSAEERQAYAQEVADAVKNRDAPPPHPDAERLNSENDAYLAADEPDQRDKINIRHAMRGDEVHYDDERALYDDDHPLDRGHLGLDRAEDELNASLGDYGDLRAFVEKLREQEER